jgi:hypothetical protein
MFLFFPLTITSGEILSAAILAATSTLASQAASKFFDKLMGD